MKRRLPVILATVGLAVSGSVGLGAAPASAHRYDNSADISCSEKNPVQTGNLIHAHPVFMNEFAVEYWCSVRYGADELLKCDYSVVRWAAGGVTGPYEVKGHCA